jgi:hypothetical protein
MGKYSTNQPFIDYLASIPDTPGFDFISSDDESG